MSVSEIKVIGCRVDCPFCREIPDDRNQIYCDLYSETFSFDPDQFSKPKECMVLSVIVQQEGD